METKIFVMQAMSTNHVITYLIKSHLSMEVANQTVLKLNLYYKCIFLYFFNVVKRHIQS